MPKIKSQYIQLHVFRSQNEGYEFLALKRSKDLKVYSGVWQVITATIESNETAVQTALRELGEETGLSPIKMWTLPTLTSFFDYKTDTVNLSPVFAVEVESDSKVVLSDEHDEHKWLCYNDILELLVLPSHKDGTRILTESILNSDRTEFEIDLEKIDSDEK